MNKQRGLVLLESFDEQVNERLDDMEDKRKETQSNERLAKSEDVAKSVSFWTEATPSVLWSKNKGELILSLIVKKFIGGSKNLEIYESWKVQCNLCEAEVCLKNFEQHRKLRCQICSHHHHNHGHVDQCSAAIKCCRKCARYSQQWRQQWRLYRKSPPWCDCGHYHAPAGPCGNIPAPALAALQAKAMSPDIGIFLPAPDTKEGAASTEDVKATKKKKGKATKEVKDKSVKEIQKDMERWERKEKRKKEKQAMKIGTVITPLASTPTIQPMGQLCWTTLSLTVLTLTFFLGYNCIIKGWPSPQIWMFFFKVQTAFDNPPPLDWQ